MTKTNKSGPRYYGDPNMLINLRNHQEIFDTRTMNRLKNDEIVFLGDLLHRSENDMLSAPNFGKKSLNELKEFLQNIGHYNFVSKGYVSRGVTFGDDKSKIIEFYGLENDAQPTWIPSKPKPLGQSSVTNEQKTPPIFTKEDFSIFSIEETTRKDPIEGTEYDAVVVRITTSERFNELVKRGLIQDANRELGILEKKTQAHGKACDFDKINDEYKGRVVLCYKKDTFDFITKQSILIGFTRAANEIIKLSQQDFIDESKETMKLLGLNKIKIK